MGKVKKHQTNLDFAKQASVAHCDLNILYAVIALMEGSLLSSECFGVEAKIVTICQSEAQKCLRRYDAALAKLGSARAILSEGKAS